MQRKIIRKKIPSKPREPLAIICIGRQGGGKTYTTKEELRAYQQKYKRPVLIVDKNGEYNQYKAVFYDCTNPDRKSRAYGRPRRKNRQVNQGARMGIAGISQPRIYRVVGRKPDGTPMTNEQLTELVLTIGDYYSNGALVLEEMNSYIRRTVPASFYSFITNLRHRGVDVYMHYQAIADAHPDIWRQTKALRLHKAMDSFINVEKKIGDKYELSRVAEIIVGNVYEKYLKASYQMRQNPTIRYDASDLDAAKYFYCYVYYEENILYCPSEQLFRTAYEQYFYENDKLVRALMKSKDRTTGKRIYKSDVEAVTKLVNDRMIHFATGK